jgi:hypothetical protein
MGSSLQSDTGFMGGMKTAMALLAEAIRRTLDRCHVAAAARWHASLTADDAAALDAYDATW